jgi:hypothetical protein
MATQLDDQWEEDAPDLDLDEGADDEPANDDGAEHDDDHDGDAPEADDLDEITFAGAAVTGADEPEGVRNLRSWGRTEKERADRAEAELARLKGGGDAVGEKPKLDDYWDRPDEYERDLTAWLERSREQDKRQQAKQEQRQRQAEAWQRQQSAFDTGYSGIRAPGKDAALALVDDSFPGEQRAYLIKAAGDKAPAFMYALGNAPEKRAQLKALAKEGAWAEFIAAAAIMATEVTMKRQRPSTQPYEAPRGQGGAARGDQRLARLEREANASGDFSKVVAYRRQQREKK